MSSVLSLVLSYCQNDYLKAEKEMDKLRNKALALRDPSYLHIHTSLPIL